MKRFAAVVLMFAMTAFGQDMASCKKAIFDPNYQVPPTLQVGDASYQQVRPITFLFSKDGIDFYGADRPRTIYGVPMSDNGAWIVGIFRDETARRAEIPQIMMRAANPNLANDYASGIKYFVAFMELQMDRDSEPFKAWMKCNTKTSSQLKCPIPHDVPLLSEIRYYQPNECIRPTVLGELLRDATPRTPYQRVGYVSPAVPLSIQNDLTKAAYLMLDRFKAEDATKKH